MPTENTRARIRIAAATVIEREGAANITLEKVAAVAGISKGGLAFGSVLALLAVPVFYALLFPASRTAAEKL